MLVVDVLVVVLLVAEVVLVDVLEVVVVAAGPVMVHGNVTERWNVPAVLCVAVAVTVTG